MRQQAASSSFRKGVSLRGTCEFELTSIETARRYLIRVAAPETACPPEGYRTLVVLDGFSYFASAVEAVRNNANAPDVLVIGIAYPEDDRFVSAMLDPYQPLPVAFQEMNEVRAAAWIARYFDLTPAASDETIRSQSLPGMFVPAAKDTGGVRAFIDFVIGEVLGSVGRMLHLDRANITLFGHSLGALAASYALLTRPDTFRCYLLSSPALWWGDGAIWSEADGLLNRLATAVSPTLVQISFGSCEDLVPNGLAEELGVDPRELERLVAQFGMSRRAREFHEWLRHIDHPMSPQIGDLIVFERLGHGLAPWAALAHGIATAFYPEC